MRATLILTGVVSLLGFVAAQDAGTTIDSTTVSGGQTFNLGTAVVQTGGDTTATDGAANTASGSSNAAAGPVGATVIDKVWLGVAAGMGIAAGGLAFGL